MRYRVRGEVTDNILEDIFRNREVDISVKDTFLYPSRNTISDHVYKNMYEGSELMFKHIREGNLICVLPDSDCDGMCSGTMIYRFIKDDVGHKNITYVLHKGKKAHGLTKEIVEEIKQIKPKLLIIPDAGSSDYKMHMYLRELGIEILVIDHHESEEYSNDAIVINNQLDEGGNKTLCGAGMVLKFIEYVCRLFKAPNYAEKYYDLAGVALVADSMIISNDETRYYVMEGLRNINNELLKALVDEERRKNFTLISYDIAPSINSIIRIGSDEEKDMLFKALIGETENITMNIRGKGDVTMPLADSVNIIANRLKSKQTRQIKKVLEDESTMIITDNLPYSILIFEGEEFSSLTGLIATKLVEKYDKPAIVVREKDGSYYGSARTPDSFPNFRSHLLQTGLFIFCAGHQGAFGLGISKENMTNLITTRLNTSLSDNAYLVDRAYLDGCVSAFDIMAVSELQDYWCKGLEEPMFYIKLEGVHKNNVHLIGSKNDTIKITNNNIVFIKFKCEEEEITPFLTGEQYNLEIIGKFNTNEWRGSVTPQVIIEKMKIKECDKELIGYNPFFFGGR